MAERLNDTEMALVKKSIAQSESLTKDEQAKLDFIKSKPVRVEDVLEMLDTSYPIASIEELDLTKRLIEAQGNLKTTKEETAILDGTRYKRASVEDVVEIVMSAYKGGLANRYRDLKNELFLLQIMIRDYMVSKPELKALAKKLNETGDLSDAGLKKVNASKLVMGKKEYKEADKTREDAYTKMVDEMNQMSDNLEKVSKERA